MNAYRAPAPVIYETQRPVKRKLTKDITCLKDFMKDPKREEPLVGLEHVVEIRFEGRREPHYECKLCEFNTEMAPMIEHLSGYKHRRAYISKEFPDKMKKNTPGVKEDKVSFLRRIAREIEKAEGLKMYKTEGYTRPSISSSSSKKKSRWEDDYKPEVSVSNFEMCCMMDVSCSCFLNVYLCFDSVSYFIDIVFHFIQ
ncbi:lateral signaling target protein 2-like protein [Platysternon megacephalum]|uniref:Lateral signaling target protein 2-like protein n=1 Tax=Platysternon megacephalum TaxID=55544 RepID=A0A4D9DWQ8_9SAUR|nr:lateral signaling target protein 2-like protein [Platysternon megacephalum]